MNQSRALALLLAAFFLLGIVYSTTTPLFETPDEQWHFAFVQSLAQGKGLPVQSLPLQHLARQEGSQPPLYYALAAALTFWIDTTDYPALVRDNPHYGFDVPGVVNDNKNLFIHTAQESFPYHNTALAIHLARLLSLLMGAVAVYFTYHITQLLISPNHIAQRENKDPSLRRAVCRCMPSAAPKQSQHDTSHYVTVKTLLPLTAACLVALTPQFLFISAAVSNDSTIVALSAIALYLLVRIFNHPPTPRAVILLSIVCGLSALAKVSGLAMLPLAALVIAYQNRRALKTLFIQEIILLVTFSLIAGWWYLRNILLYGELTGTARMVQIFGGRIAPLTLDGWRAQLYEVFETFWVGFGWGNLRAPEWVYALVGIAALLGIIGLALLILRALQTYLSFRTAPTAASLLSPDTRHPSPHSSPVTHHPSLFSPLLVLAAWGFIVLLALLQWMIQTQAPHGRLLFPALPALAPLIVVGWMQLIPSRAQTLVLRAAPLALFIFALAAPFLLLAPAYALPPTLAETDIQAIPARVDIRYDDTLMLLGSSITPHPLDPRGALQVDLYWRVLGKTNTAYSLNLSALDENNRVVTTRISYPGHGTLPTTLMLPGQIFHDTYWLPTRAPSGSLQVTVFDRLTHQDLPAFDPANNEITPIVNRFALTP